MAIFEDTNPRALKELLTEINSGAMVLPDFQRDFVWEPRDIADLIVSIANNFPAGSLLRVRDTHRAFAARAFEGAPSFNGKRHTYLVLDGQQRLTSLYQAFFGVGEYRFYLDVQRLLQGEDLDEAVFYERATSRYAKQLELEDVQADAFVLPLSMLKGGAGGFGRWSRKVARRHGDKERIELEDALDRVEERWVQSIDDYQFPVVTLSDSTHPEALCTIFETLNRKGIKLRVFELLTARFWPAGVNLRALWDAAQERGPLLKDYEVDPYYLLQAIALLSRRTPSCKRSDVLELSADDINAWWEPVVDGMLAGLELLRDDCGVALAKWLPYQPMLVPLSASMAGSSTQKTPDVGARRERITRWFWCSVFGQTYESAANSRSAKDFSELRAWFDGREECESVAHFRFNPSALREVTPRQRAVYNGVICLVLSNRPRDFHTREVITSKLIRDEGIDDHHVFPAKYLETKKLVGSATLSNCVLNRTLIDRTTNQMINDQAPSKYLGRIRKTKGFPFEKVLASHWLPPESEGPLLQDDYESFLGWRERHLWREIQRVTGVSDVIGVDGGAV